MHGCWCVVLYRQRNHYQDYVQMMCHKERNEHTFITTFDHIDDTIITLGEIKLLN